MSARWSAEGSGRAPVGRYGNADRHLRENDAIIDLGNGEVLDLDGNPSAERLFAAAAKLRARRFLPVEFNPFADKPEPMPRHDVPSLNVQRVDFDYEADAADMRTKRALVEITKALAEQEMASKKSQADKHQQLKQAAGSMGRLLIR